MRTFKTTLKLCTHAFQTDWDVAVQAAVLAYRATPHTVTGHTPFFLMTGQEVVSSLSREWHEWHYARWALHGLRLSGNAAWR